MHPIPRQEMPETGDLTPPGSTINIGRLLLRAFELFQEEIVAAVQEAGYADIRPADTRALRNLDEEGTRITELARRARVTKQAMSQLVQDLEARGYVERHPDPLDGRAKRVRLTEAGRGVRAAAAEGHQQIREAWMNAIGETGFRTLHHRLTELLDRHDALPEFRDPLDWPEDRT